jgi:predicted DNA-binding transcriptional regulator AlpA
MQKFLDYSDLKERGVAPSRMTHKRMIDNEGFPPGRLISPNRRVWTEEEVEEWLVARPTARKPPPWQKRTDAAPAPQTGGGKPGPRRKKPALTAAEGGL